MPSGVLLKPFGQDMQVTSVEVLNVPVGHGSQVKVPAALSVYTRNVPSPHGSERESI